MKMCELPSGWSNKRFSELGIQKARDVFCQIVDACSGNVTLFPLFGTALGLAREGDLIEHDIDLDFGCKLSEHQKLYEIMSEYNIVRNSLNGKLMTIHTNTIQADFYLYSDDWTTANPSYRLEKEWVEPLAVRSAFGSEYLSMNKPEAFLESYYGNWKIPVVY